MRYIGGSTDKARFLREYWRADEEASSSRCAAAIWRSAALVFFLGVIGIHGGIADGSSMKRRRHHERLPLSSRQACL